MAQVISREDALSMAVQATQGRVPKSHLAKLLRTKSPDGKALKYFWSAPTRGFGGKGQALVIVDHNEDFHRRVMAAVHAEPYARKGVDLSRISPPSEPEFAERTFD